MISFCHKLKYMRKQWSLSKLKCFLVRCDTKNYNMHTRRIHTHEEWRYEIEQPPHKFDSIIIRKNARRRRHRRRTIFPFRRRRTHYTRTFNLCLQTYEPPSTADAEIIFAWWLAHTSHTQHSAHTQNATSRRVYWLPFRGIARRKMEFYLPFDSIRCTEKRPRVWVNLRNFLDTPNTWRWRRRCKVASNFSNDATTSVLSTRVIVYPSYVHSTIWILD